MALVEINKKEKEAYDYAKNKNISFTKSSKIFGIDYEKLYKMDRQGFKEINNKLFLINETLEKIEESIEYYINNEKVSLSKIHKNFGFTSKTFQKYLSIFNIQLKDNRLKFNRRIFKDIDNKEKSYWLGFIFADGCIFRNELRIKLSIHDEDHLKKFIRFIDGEKDIKIQYETHTITGNKLCKVVLTDKEMIQDLKDKGLDYNKTGKENIPNIDEKFINHFIRGYFDGDGHISSTKNISLGFVSGEKILTYFKEILMKDLKVNDVKVKFDKISHIYRISWQSKKDIINIINYLYNDSNKEIQLDRKYNSSMKFKELHIMDK